MDMTVLITDAIIAKEPTVNNMYSESFFFKLMCNLGRLDKGMIITKSVAVSEGENPEHRK